MLWCCFDDMGTKILFGVSAASTTYKTKQELVGLLRKQGEAAKRIPTLSSLFFEIFCRIISHHIGPWLWNIYFGTYICKPWPANNSLGPCFWALGLDLDLRKITCGHWLGNIYLFFLLGDTPWCRFLKKTGRTGWLVWFRNNADASALRSCRCVPPPFPAWAIRRFRPTSPGMLSRSHITGFVPDTTEWDQAALRVPPFPSGAAGTSCYCFIPGGFVGLSGVPEWSLYIRPKKLIACAKSIEPGLSPHGLYL